MNDLIETFDNIFSQEKCNELARKYRFIQRSSSKLQGAEFIKALILPLKIKYTKLNVKF